MSNVDVLVLEGRPNRVFIAGDIDVVTGPRLAEVLCDLRGDITVDCTDISFIDSAGFTALDSGYLVATAAGNTFDVTGLPMFPARIARLLQVPYVRCV
jgi:anti-anti-sigma regulatory factor